MKIPWISTFETLLTRLTKVLEKCNQNTDKIDLGNKEMRTFNAINGTACKHLIALSEWTKLIQLDLTKRLSLDANIIQSKLTVFYPPREKIINAYKDK